MSVVEKLIIEDGGRITLPSNVLDRYGLADETIVRIIETQKGILLIPLTDEPMSEALASELREWQAVGSESWDMFPFEEPEQ
ncbi:MAG: AbrB/MazE/SpoVT family DNA-binding domain-containing protein [Rubrivivax sp.]|nr:AbrB/MazE/SpoVT family DNA-binding domain-containing protein [Pyrinomonadaceae bacterium]